MAKKKDPLPLFFSYIFFAFQIANVGHKILLT